MRELTKAELDAIAETLGANVGVSQDASGRKRLESHSRQEKIQKKRPFYKSYFFWAAFSIVAGLLAVSSIFYLIVQLNAFLGDGVLQYLASQNLGADAIKEMESNGAHGLREGLMFYNYRWVAVGGILLVSIIIAVLFLYLEERRKIKEEHKERMIIEEKIRKESRLTDSEQAVLEESLKDVE